MKKLFTVLIMLFAVNSYSQFSVSSSLGQGIKFNDEFDYTLYQSTISVQAGFTFDKFILNSISTSVLTDSVTSYYAGIQPGYEFWTDENKSMSINGLIMLGTAGNRLAGLGFGYTNDNIKIGINAMRELNLKETWIEAVIGFNIYKEK